MKRNRWFGIGLTVVLSAGLLAACSSKGEGSGSEAAGIPPASNAASKPAGSGTIDFLFGDPNRTELFGRITKSFNGSQSDVSVSFKPSGLQHLEQLRTRLATNDAPDMTSQLQGFELASYVKEGYIKDLKNEEFMKKINPSELETVKVGDGIYGIPMDTQAWGVFYNKKLFEKAGIQSPPKTISELKADVEKLKAAGITPFAAGFATPWTIGQFLGYAASPILTPKVTANIEEYKKGNWTFDVPGMDEALSVLDLIVANTQPRPFDSDVSGQYAVFAKGDAAMMVQGNWSIVQLRELNKDLDMGMFPLPISEDPNLLKFPKQYGFVINVLENAKDMDAVRKYVDYFMDSNGEAKVYYDSIGIPTANSTADPKLDSASEELQQYLKDNKTVFTYYSYEPAGFDAESWKIIVDYIYKGEKDHKKLIGQFDAAFKKFAGSLSK
ncbi:ABC transporter substrate-binding protein [Cohnella caldifontis]|uniref:ABC transporter substrate-binding protein n=1 Tax=Cohnella caldifontis TaxID=3027471 RepID=UPI0023EDAC8B|nr:extracellular solute-binding protein [Cohnella sp. YIM B05605]